MASIIAADQQGDHVFSVLVTGSSRGLGLEWCRQYADAGWRVFATCRHPAAADALRSLAQSHPRLSVHRLDVTLPESVYALLAELQDEAIDVLVNNAGVYLEKSSAYRRPRATNSCGRWVVPSGPCA
jgi:NAD(P)-dependent dehydrogenase (short-subunit alcohol dehydrogenase family)